MIHKVIFEGGMLDGYQQEVHEKDNWSEVKKIAIMDSAGKRFIQFYESQGPRESQTTITCQFSHVAEMILEPGEECRAIRFKVNL